MGRYISGNFISKLSSHVQRKLVQPTSFLGPMQENNLIPEIFYSLMDQADKLNQLDESVMDRYYELLNEAANFVPELVAVIGPDAFELLVKNYGGRTITIPSADNIISFVRKNEPSDD